MRQYGMDSSLSRAALGILFLASASTSALAGGIKVPAGELRGTTLADLKPHPSGSKTYNELWSYHIALDGNIQAVLNISRVNLGSFKAPVCGADLTLLGFKGRNYTVAREYEKSNFIFIDSLHQLQVHKNIWFSGKLPEAHRTFFATRKKDVDYFLDLEFSDILPGKVWGDGMFKLGSETVGIFMHIPRAKVSGRLAINGDTVRVSGTAYMDHTFQTTLAPELVDAGYRYIAPAGNLEAAYLLDPDSEYGSAPLGYGLRMEDGALTLLKPASLAVPSANKAMGIKVSTKLEITWQDGSKSVVERSVDRQQQSYLHEFSGITKMAIKRFMGGEILGFKGNGTLNGSQPVFYNYFIVD
jgi:hypothetical protein